MTFSFLFFFFFFVVSPVTLVKSHGCDSDLGAYYLLSSVTQLKEVQVCLKYGADIQSQVKYPMNYLNYYHINGAREGLIDEYYGRSRRLLQVDDLGCDTAELHPEFRQFTPILTPDV
ncbi:hypothetical protein CISG_00164 [Coccidioides immitis RMSCC 3703]|uniref:Uncharacterized protein n=2 Tax=Coccidioides immitis TaxID=5501 RepID=A0A0J8QHM8_COCIT|nr:hypothetical protein CIRG_07373 [Coccidioides immitis RMSCC 2394]KMU71854.1 hypothetical protein CISG_00164 [Coccidioides immitis RMSCC 3703]